MLPVGIFFWDGGLFYPDVPEQEHIAATS